MIFRLLLFCLLPASLLAQSPDSTEVINRLQFGIGVGLMDHEIDVTPRRDLEMLQGRSLSVNLRYFDTKLVGFQAELGYSQAGWREDLGDTLTTAYERNVDFVELQILTQLSIGRGFLQPMLQAGPYLSFPVGSREDIPVGYRSPDTVLPDIVGLDFPNRVNYGAQVGAGLNVEIGPLTLQLEGRYLIGFSDLFAAGTSVVATSRRQGLGGRVALFYAFRQ